LPREIALAAYHRRDASWPVRMLGGETMGTNWSIRFAAPPDCYLPAIESVILARLETIIAEMSHWRSDSLISAFNHAAPGSWIDLPNDFATVMHAAIDVAARSGGAVDPTIGRVVALRGFGPDPDDRSGDEAQITDALGRAGWRRLQFSGERLYQPGGLALDLSGIAKGYAVDAVADLLNGTGIADALVEIGGELVGRGIRPDGEPWWVDLEDVPGITMARLRIALHGLAVATSGDYRRGWHTIDPRSGRSVDNGVRSTSVLHERAMVADAWATALTVLGPSEGLAMAEREGLAVRIIADREYLSPALVDMLEY